MSRDPLLDGDGPSVLVSTRSPAERTDGAAVPAAVEHGRGDRRAAVKLWGGVTAIYGVLAAAFMWPVPVRPSRYIYGYGGDGLGFIYEVATGRSQPLTFWRASTIDRLAYPDGYTSSNWIRVQTFVTDLIVWPLSKFAGAVATYNVVIFIGLVATAVAMFALARYLTSSVLVALWAGAAFALFPFIQLAAGSWPSFTHMYWLPLTVLTALHFRDHPSTRSAILLPAPVLGAMATNGYTGFFALVVFVSMSIVWIPTMWATFTSMARAARRRTSAIVVAAGGFVLLVALVLVPRLKGSVHRDVGELGTYGLRLQEIVRPNYLQRYSPDWISPLDPAAMHGSNAVEVAQYVGWSTILLAMIGAIAMWRSPTRRLLAAALAGIAGAVLIGMSYVEYFGVPAPARVVHAVVPFFRVYSRFGVVVFLFLVVLAVHGLRRLMVLRTPVGNAAVVLVAVALTFVDLWSPYPGRYREVAAPAFTSAVDGNSSPVVAFYPFVRSDDGYFYEQLVWTLYLPPSARFVNGAPSDTAEDDLREQVRSLNSKDTWDDLAALGVDLVVIDKPAYLARHGHPVSQYAGRVLFEDDTYAVVSLAADARALGWLEGDMHPAEVRETGASWRWLRDDTSVIVRSSSPGCARVTGFVGAPDGDLEFDISAPGGAAVPVAVDTATGRFEFAVRVRPGETALRLDPRRDLSPMSVADTRPATLYMSDVDVTLVDDGSCT
jgi:hypothetical protein